MGNVPEMVLDMGHGRYMFIGIYLLYVLVNFQKHAEIEIDINIGCQPPQSCFCKWGGAFLGVRSIRARLHWGSILVTRAPDLWKLPHCHTHRDTHTHTDTDTHTHTHIR